jgi:hypothetical protein
MEDKREKCACGSSSCKGNKLIFYGIIIGIVILFLAFIIPKYFTGEVTASGIKISGDIEKIEIIHFHGTSQCSSCIAVGNLAEETINIYFSNELESGKITFQHVNAELSENYEIAKKYKVTGSSLWIGTYYTEGKFIREENINVWYKINNKENYMDYLKGVIESKLSGE